ncbi:MAG: hypothetical protein FWG73_03690 [Planctomycetaceae bacterium]|nr:hypothetical protein [Planctomycetaceae bacterium]
MKVCSSTVGLLLLLTVCALAQYPGNTYPHAPGQAYFQPVLIRTPDATSLAAVTHGQFSERLPSPLQAGFLLGCEYRLKIAGIPFNPGREVFPTVTLLARTYPPQGKEIDHPIIINLTLEDLELALAGQHITRVIYLENPNSAMPIQTGNDTQLSHDIRIGDPVAAAATQGLPVAIVRIGGRVPMQNTPGGLLSPEFTFGSPPWVLNKSDALASQGDTAHARTNTPQDDAPHILTFDPALKTAGLAVIERQQEMQMEMQQHLHIWHPPHPSAGPGGRPDEFIVTGNDAGKPAFVEDWTVNNFAAGDTIAHFDTVDGRIIVEPSNRIHIYAPRFGAIRKIEGLVQEGQVTALINKQSHQSVGHNQNAIQTSHTEQETRTQYSRTQDQIRGIESQRRGAGLETSQSISGYNNFLVVDSDSMTLLQRSFGMEGSTRVQLERGSLNARAWMGSEGVRVQVNELAPMTQIGVDGAIVYFQIVDEQSKTSQLRLIKVASRDSASPGEMIEFTLRFDNIGSQPIGNVTILDDLTGRLEFLSGTAVSSLQSGFASQPNASGGLSLRFEILDPLLPGDFGVIQFRCRVR